MCLCTSDSTFFHIQGRYTQKFAVEKISLKSPLNPKRFLTANFEVFKLSLHYVLWILIYIRWLKCERFQKLFCFSKDCQITRWPLRKTDQALFQTHFEGGCILGHFYLSSQTLLKWHLDKNSFKPSLLFPSSQCSHQSRDYSYRSSQLGSTLLIFSKNNRSKTFVESSFSLQMLLLILEKPYRLCYNNR